MPEKNSKQQAEYPRTQSFFDDQEERDAQLLQKPAQNTGAGDDRGGFFTEPGRGYASKFPQRVPFTFNSFFIILAFCLFHQMMNVLGPMTIALFKFVSVYHDVLPSDSGFLMQEVLYNQNIANAGAVLMAIFVIPIYLAFIKSRKKKQPRTVLCEKPEKRTLQLSFLLIFASLAFSMLTVMAMQLLSDKVPFIAQELEKYQNLVETVSGLDARLGLQIAALVIFVPLAEDLLFRGIIMGELFKYMSPAAAIVTQALLFSLFHLNFVQSTYVFFPGIALGLAYALSGNLKVPIFLHMIYNFIGGIVPVIFDNGADESLSAPMLALLLIELLSAVFAVSGIYKLYRERKIDQAL